MNHALTVARQKLGKGEDWLMCGWRMIGNTQDLVMTGCVPAGVYVSGPRKGRPKFAKPFDEAVVTKAEHDAEFARYEAATGICGECGGERQTWAGWSAAEGTKYRPCRRCNATGKAP